MKLWSKTFILVIIALLVAFGGSTLNSYYYENSSINDVLAEAETSFKEFQKNYDQAKKTIVIIGRSTSLYSFNDQEAEPVRNSYADLLKYQANVLNLSSISLFNIAQAKALLKFARQNVSKIDLIVLENLFFMRSVDIFEGYNYFQVVELCAKDGLRDILYPSRGQRIHEKFICRGLLETNLGESKFIPNPCIKKYQEALKLSFIKGPQDRVKMITQTLKCDRGAEVQLYLTRMFYHEFFDDLKRGFLAIGRDVSVWEKEYMEDYTTDELILINKFTAEMFPNHDQNVLLIPAFSKITKHLEELSVFHREDGKVQLLDISGDISRVKNQNHLSFGDVFHDGSHSKTWVHELIASKISELYFNVPEKK
ncbi:hypothetical protein DOM21_00335 [Bacteriovorax stolpii]|uniref:Uncharacterized protein n=1 Tax=Bacteriovorax stolpii TaxID=960 RepID=A0A2K9NX36_BACTC|nr:hypothetical protein [Bacteriovorax stolpii]AUO00078.1 hypothetical protein C0V70_18595 [Bacteriovorax stolpii]QDK39930.1 hypothetical protein DOM21_00335 [Bacteriovorax stolpii]TDP54029.1 hypothetical protein C8D79_1312 [Bacteriovorax stolpii]